MANRPRLKRVSTKALERQAYIRDAAIELFSSRGYGATSIDELAEKTKMNKGTIYYYYSSKSDILLDIILNSLFYIIERTNESDRKDSSRDAIEIIIDELVDWSINSRPTATVLFQEQAYFSVIFTEPDYAMVSGLQRRFMRRVYEILQKGVESKEFDLLDIKTAGRILVSGVNSAYTWQSQVNPKRTREATKEIFLRGILRNERH